MSIVTKQAPKYRKWVCTVQNPDPGEDFVKKMLGMVDSIKYLAWSYEMGNDQISDSNPAYTDDYEGGNLHYQVYFETTKQYRQSAISTLLTDEEGNKIWIQWSYAPQSAENYAIKSDKTLVDGPWFWGSKGQGERNDLKAARAAIEKDHLNYESLRRTGKHDTVCAKYRNYIKEIAMDVEAKELKPITWPIVLKHKFNEWKMDKPNPAVKKRSWWIVADPDWGKTYWANETLGDMLVYSIPNDARYRYENYQDEDIIIYDDKSCSFAEYSDVLNTFKLRQQVSGAVRNVTKYWKRNHTRNIIVLTNKTIEQVGFSEAHVPAMHARFITIDLRKKAEIEIEKNDEFYINEQ